MLSRKRIYKRVNNFMYDHVILAKTLHELSGAFIAIFTATLFSFGFVCFITPASQASLDAVNFPSFTLVTGGVSGLCQNIALMLRMGGVNITATTVQSIGLFAFNVPLLIFAFFKVGKRFAILSAINVISSSIFIRVFADVGLGEIIAKNSLIITNVLSRCLFAGVCAGAASAISYKAEVSCGGMDIVTYYFSIRKSTSVGKYNVALNAFIVTLYSILIFASDPTDISRAILSIFFSLVYLLVNALVVDTINVRNKKIEIQIITTNENTVDVLMNNFPHGITINKVKGAYSGQEKIMLWMVVSTHEVNKVVRIARKADQHAFVTVTHLAQVYGNFFIKPIE